MTFSAQVKAELAEAEETLRRRAGRKKTGAAAKKREQELADRDALRTLFLEGGTVSDPKRSYHLELNCGEREAAEETKERLARLQVAGKIHRRRQDWCVYLKGADDIARLLGLMGASKAMMDLENARILHDISGTINRQVNCETANQNKTIKASLEQLQKIEILERHGALKKLPPELYELAMLRKD
ncbi:MAG: DNA-binding protein WhiA, partial [Lachnospiraceae bacterium]|nr:DNA-binding protein WhiA [Lachnospiraceae bacterium]